MQIMVAVLMMMALLASVDIRPTESRDARRQAVETAATHLLWTHTHAVSVCTATPRACSPGELRLGLGTPGASAAGVYPTWTDGAAVVTTWAPSLGRDIGAGELAAALLDATSDAATVGVYDAAAGTVSGTAGGDVVVVVPDDLRAGLRGGYPVALTCPSSACLRPR